jgi:hypothetical protein
LVCDLLSGVLRALAALAFIKGSTPIPWETQSFGDQSAPQSAPITDYQAEQFAINDNPSMPKGRTAGTRSQPIPIGTSKRAAQSMPDDIRRAKSA